MPLKNFINIGTLQSYEYLIGKITEVDVDNDTCDLTIGENSYSAVPIFFHCSPESEERANGALLGAAKAFREDDEVVVLVLRGEEVPENEKSRMYVIALTDGKRYCSGLIVIVSTWSGNEAFAWDLLSNKLFIKKTTLSDLQSKFAQDGVPLEPSGSNDFCWDRTTIAGLSYTPPASNLPMLITGSYPDDEGKLFVLDTPVVPATPSFNFLGIVNKWDFTHYYLRNPFDTVEEAEATQKAPYLIDMKGNSDVSEEEYYEEVTGCDWDKDIPPDLHYLDIPYYTPYRQYLFWNTTFGYPIHGVQANYYNLQLTTERIFDNWEDTHGCASSEEMPNFYINRSLGIASISNEEEEPETAVLFEYVGICIDWEEESGCKTCDDCYQVLTMKIYARNDNLFIYGLSKECFEAVNAVRTVKALAINQQLMIAAKRHLNDLMTNFTMENISHTGSDGTSPFDRVTQSGFNLWMHRGLTYGAGENITAFVVDEESELTPIEQAIENWRNSPAHWANIQNTSLEFTETGVAVGIVPAIPATETEPEIPAWYVFVQVFGFREEHWAGFAPIDTEELKTYMIENLTFSNAQDKKLGIKLYLINSKIEN